MFKRESYRSSHAPFSTIAPLLDSEFDDVMSEGWLHNGNQPRYREALTACTMADIIS